MIARILVALITIPLVASCLGPAGAPMMSTGPAAADAIRGVHHVGITVSDIDQTLAFYSAAVPYELVERDRVTASTIPGELLTKRDGEVEIALVRTPTMFLRLLDVDPDGLAQPNRVPVTGPGYTHICFQSHAADPRYDRFKELGLDILSRGDAPVDLGGYGVTYAYGYDADGIMIEMEQLSSEVVAASGELGKKKKEHTAWISHVANVTGDKLAMVEFYSKVLGHGPKRELPPTKRKTFDDVVDIDDIEIAASWFDAGNIQLEFWNYLKPATPKLYRQRKFDDIGYNSVVFEVTDLSGTVARLEAQGIKFAGDAFEFGGRMIRYAHDPEGNLLAFQERLATSDPYSIESVRWFARTRSPDG